MEHFNYFYRFRTLRQRRFKRIHPAANRCVTGQIHQSHQFTGTVEFTQFVVGNWGSGSARHRRNTGGHVSGRLITSTTSSSHLFALQQARSCLRQPPARWVMWTLCWV